MTVRYSRHALAQISDIVRAIETDDPRAAAVFVGRIKRLSSLLSRHPEIGRATDLPGVRVAPTRPFPYLLFYSRAPQGITVLRVRRMARKEDWRSGR